VNSRKWERLRGDGEDCGGKATGEGRGEMEVLCGKKNLLWIGKI
jgi:hypothetical protein